MPTTTLRDQASLTIQRDLAEVLKESADQADRLTDTVAVQQAILARQEGQITQLLRDNEYLIRVVRDGSDNSQGMTIRLRDLENNTRNSDQERKQFWRTLGAVALTLITAIIGAVASLYAARLGK